MKSGAVLCLACVLASVLPAAAARGVDGQLLAAATEAATLPVAQDATDAPADQPKKKPKGKSTATTSSTAQATKPRRHKKPDDDQPAVRSGAAIVKEGGKTCSGLDQYRVCW
jgi:ribosome-binding protein aMBF1 (putative translation factor)